MDLVLYKDGGYTLFQSLNTFHRGLKNVFLKIRKSPACRHNSEVYTFGQPLQF